MPRISELTVLPWREEEMDLACPPDHPLARQQTVRAEQLSGEKYIGFDKVLGSILKHVDENTYLFIVSDHGIKPLREFEETNPHAHMDHEKTTPVIAKSNGFCVPSLSTKLI